MRAWFCLASACLVACTSLDAGGDRDGVLAELRRRAGDTVPPPSLAVDAAIDGEVTALLRRPLDDDTAVRIALLNNRSVRATYEALGVARAELVQAGLLRNPVFDGDARFLFDGGTELELGLAVPFLDLFWRPLRQRLAEHEFAAARARITEELVHLVFAVRRAMVDLRANEQLATVHRDALRAAEAAHELAVALHSAGNLTDQALALERTGESRARLDLAAAELAAHEAREPLQRLLGLWGEHTEWSIAGQLDPEPLQGLDLAHVEGRAIAASLALAAHRAKLDALAVQADFDGTRAWLPDGAFGASAIREPYDEWGLGPHLNLELPFFDSGSARRGAATARLRAGLQHHTQRAVEVRSAARTLRDRATHLAERARFLREVHLPQRAEVVRTTLQTYNAMQIGVFDVLAQKRLQLADAGDYVQTLQAAHQAQLDLRELLAGGSPEAAAMPVTMPAPTATEPAKGGHE